MDATRTKKCKKIFICCLSGVESRLGGDVGFRGTCKERIKCMSSAYVTDNGQSTYEFCCMSNGCITDKTNMYRICNGQYEYVPYLQRTKRSLNDHRTHLTSPLTDCISFVSWDKNLIHYFMMPPKGKSTKTLQVAGEEDVSADMGGGAIAKLD